MSEDRKRFEMAPDTGLLLAKLRLISIGEVVTYNELGEAIDRKIDGSDSYLQTARRIAERELETVFKPVHKIGYRRLTDAEIAREVPDRFTDRLRRSANRVVRQLSYARDEHLTNEEKIRRNTGLAFAGALAHATKAKPQKALEERVRASSRILPIAETLENLKSN